MMGSGPLGLNRAQPPYNVLCLSFRLPDADLGRAKPYLLVPAGQSSTASATRLAPDEDALESSSGVAMRVFRIEPSKIAQPGGDGRPSVSRWLAVAGHR